MYMNQKERTGRLPVHQCTTRCEAREKANNSKTVRADLADTQGSTLLLNQQSIWKLAAGTTFSLFATPFGPWLQRHCCTTLALELKRLLQKPIGLNKLV